MNNSRRTIRDRFIRGAIVAAKRGDNQQVKTSITMALRYTRAINATERDSSTKRVI